MAAPTIEERLATLEAEVARLKQNQTRTDSPAAPWWRKRFGAFKNNPLYDEAMTLGAEYRKSQPMPGDEDVSP